MTTQEAQSLLNIMYPPQRVGKYHIKANEQLSSVEIDILLRIVCDFDSQKQKFNYNNAFNSITQIASRFITQAQLNKSGKKIPANAKSMPLLIQQVLFYMAVAGKEYNLYTQTDIVDILKQSGLKIGKIYTKMPFEPQYYISYDNYEIKYKSIADKVYSQPQVLFKYNGQKSEELGVVIKSLVYQAGKFDRFVDSFGGTASATLAFPKRGYTEYVYNELNQTLYELYEVIKSSDYKFLIKELNSLKKALLNEKLWLSYPDVDFEAEMTQYFSRPVKREVTSRQERSGEQSLYDYRNADTYADFKDVLKYIRQDIGYNVELMKDDFTFEYENILYTKQELLNKIFSLNDYECFMSYIKEWDFYHSLAGKVAFNALKVTRKNEDNKEDAYVRNLEDNKLRDFQVRFYEYYCYFGNLLKQSGVDYDKVRRSLAYIFLMSFATRNRVGISAILRMTAAGGKAKDNQWKSFLYPAKANKKNKMPEQSEIIKTLHNEFKKVSITNLDFRQVIVKESNKETLFYVDSPYIGTTDYSGLDFDANNAKVPAFKNEYMIELIKQLAQVSKQGDKFIFSCRACFSAKDRTDNSILKEYLYDVFSREFIDKNIPLWVVTIQEDSSLDFFADLVANHKEAEIMIVNYEVQTVPVDRHYPNAKYETYTFNDFLTKMSAYL